MPRLVSFLAPIATLACISAAVARSLCGSGNLCGSAAPWCSEFGFCGIGTQCLGGCNPLHSHSLTSCTPKPICEDETITFTNLDRVSSNNTLYDGNATLHDVVVDSGTAFVSLGNELVLTLSQTNTGTSFQQRFRYRIVSNMSWTQQSVDRERPSFSDVKDEIDWNPEHRQLRPSLIISSSDKSLRVMITAEPTMVSPTPFPIIIITPSVKILTPRESEAAVYHFLFESDGTPGTLTWEMDGDVVRTLNRADNLSAGGACYFYPSTPSRVQMKLVGRASGALTHLNVAQSNA